MACSLKHTVSVIHLKMSKLLTAKEVSKTLSCARSYVEKLQLKGVLNPVSTIYPKYYFSKEEVLKVKTMLKSKKKKI
mgnify:CR=1 FL=1